MSDWRLQGQERYLKGVDLCWATYEGIWEHDHCEFCSWTFAVQGGDFNAGYMSNDRYHWVCKDCYEDFKSMFDWKIVPCA